jgi:hypothetical protein
MIYNNQHTEIAGMRFCLIPIVQFEEWLVHKHQSLDKFNSLKRDDKEKVFLRWKWGFEDDNVNEALEFSERVTLKQFKDQDISLLPEATRFHVEHKQAFDLICQDIKQRIGLIKVPNPIVDKVADAFEAKEY